MYTRFGLFFLLCIFLTLDAFAQFEGTIAFQRKSKTDTLICTFQVKGDMVKYEEKFTNNAVKRYIVVDLDNGESATVYPSQNRIEREKVPSTANQGTFTIFKKQNTKKIKGRNCEQWIVKNINEKTMFIFYVEKGQYAFYSKFSLFAAHFTDLFHYFSAVANSKGAMPLEAKKTTFLWDVIYDYELLKYEPGIVSDSVFRLPK